MNIVLEIIITFKNILTAWSSSVCQFFVPPDRKSVAGEIVLITGGGSGVGRRLAIEFAHLRAVVVLWDVDSKGVQETEKLIQQAGGVCHAYVCDVSDAYQVQKQGELVQGDVGHVTILVNAASVVSCRPLLESCEEDIQRSVRLNLHAHFWTSKFFLPAMLENNHGHIVNVASSAGLVGLSQLSDYSAAKFGVVGLTEVLNYEMEFGGYNGVHITLVCPPLIADSALFEGCHMRFPNVAAPKLGDTVSRIMQAILTNQKQVYIPRVMYLLASLKTIMPVSVMTLFIKFLGSDMFMDGLCRGHHFTTILPAAEPHLDVVKMDVTREH